MIGHLAKGRDCLHAQQEGTENMYRRDSPHPKQTWDSKAHTLMLSNSQGKGVCEQGSGVLYSHLSRPGSEAALVTKTKTIHIITELKVWWEKQIPKI